MVVTPVSRAGRAVHGFLLAGAAQPAAHGTFHGPVGAMELLFQVYSVAARRALAREPGAGAVTAHVEQAFARLGIEPRERTVHKGVRVTDAALGRVPWQEGAFARDFDLISRLLTDLVRARGWDEAQIGALVAEGEHRMRRLRLSRRRAGQGGRRPWRRLWDAVADRLLAAGAPREAPAPAADGGGPRSITGAGLRALARYDSAAVRALPDDPSPASTQAVIDRAFAIAVRERFGYRPDLGHIGTLAAEVVRLFPIAGVTHADVQSVVLAEFTDLAGAAMGPQTALEIKIAVFVRVADDLGLYEQELDDMIIMAEVGAEEDGYELSPLRA